MKIAIVTGASSGMGREFVRQLGYFYKNLDEIWVIARRKERLEALAKESRVPLRIFAGDLQKKKVYKELRDSLEKEQPDLRMLVNSAGFGKSGSVEEILSEKFRIQTDMVDVNCRPLTSIPRLCLPYMLDDSLVINVASIAAFAPTPRMSVYSATKAYVLALSKALHDELRPRGIKVLAVCPGPMKTEFLDVGSITGRSPAFEYLPYCDQVRVAAGALRAAKAGRTMYTPRLFYKFYRLLVKVAPVKLMVKFTKT